MSESGRPRTSRYGLHFTASLAAVPAWAPVGADADDVRSVFDETADVEMRAHHQLRWGHVTSIGHFLELLTLDRFDAEELARCAVDVGADRATITARHRDASCWWRGPTAGDDLSVADAGPRRDVVAEFAAACERNGIDMAVTYAPPDDPRHAEDQLADLRARFGSSRVQIEGRPPPGSVVVRDEPPEAITSDSWVLRRPVGRGVGHNRNEVARHHLDARHIVALLTEVLAKGGGLILDIGVAADGSLPPLQIDPVREAATWVHRYRHLVDHARPWQVWGDADVRYLCVDDELVVVDTAGDGRFAALTSGELTVTEVRRIDGEHDSGGDDDNDGDGDGGIVVPFTQSESGTVLHRRRQRTTDAARSAHHDPLGIAVYRISVAHTDAPTRLFDQHDDTPIDLGELLAGSRPGDVVQLGAGTYRGPVTVGDGVIVRGVGAGRTRIEPDPDVTASSAVLLGSRARLEHLTVDTHADGEVAAVHVGGAHATVLACSIDGQVHVEADDVVIRATAARQLVGSEADRLTLSRCALRGDRRSIAVQIFGGKDQEIDACEMSGHLGGVRVSNTSGTVVRGNVITARRWAVHLDGTASAHVHGNTIDATMRAVHIAGGERAVVDGNAVADGDSGCVVEGGAVDCEVAGNHWERCRIGLLDWDSTGLQVIDNSEVDLLE